MSLRRCLHYERLDQVCYRPAARVAMDVDMDGITSDEAKRERTQFEVLEKAKEDRARAMAEDPDLYVFPSCSLFTA